MGGASAVFGTDGVVLGIFVGWTLLAAWIVFLGGAEWLEDTCWGDFLLGMLYELIPGSPLLVVKVAVALLWVMVAVALLLVGHL